MLQYPVVVGTGRNVLLDLGYNEEAGKKRIKVGSSALHRPSSVPAVISEEAIMETEPITSELLWRSMWIAMLIDAPLLFIIARSVSSGLFRKLKWYLAGAAFVVYAALWGTFGSVYFWDTVYSAIFPGWFRWLLPLLYGLLDAAVALLFWRVSITAARWQAMWFSLLGAVLSVAGHSIGISRGLLRVPLLAQASAASALAFGAFEYIFYWCLIVALGAIVHKAVDTIC